MLWHLLRLSRIGTNISRKNMITVGMFGKVRLICFTAETIPFSREYTTATYLLKGQPQPPNSRKKINEPKAVVSNRTITTLACDLLELVELEGIDTLTYSINITTDRTITDPKQSCHLINAKTGSIHQFCKFSLGMYVHT